MDKNNEGRGSRATPSGRVFRSERVSSAACRILKRETGISVRVQEFEFRGFDEVITPLEHVATLIFRFRVKKAGLGTDERSSEAR